MVLTGISLIAGGIAFAMSLLDPHAADARAVRLQIGVIERQLRLKDRDSLPLYEEEARSEGRSEGSLLGDLDRLSRVGNLRLEPQAVAVERDTAVADYRVSGRPATNEPPLTAGRFTFHRVGKRWALASNEFSLADKPQVEVRRSHLHRADSYLVSCVQAIAVLAAVAAMVIGSYPWLDTVWRRRRERHRSTRL